MAAIPWGDARRHKPPPPQPQKNPRMEAWLARPMEERKEIIASIVATIKWHEEPEDSKLPPQDNWKEQDEYTKKVLLFLDSEADQKKRRRGIDKALAHIREKRFAINDLVYELLTIRN